MIPVVAVLGPTASGKSALALDLAESLGGEIVSADSAQVYRGADVGTAKPTPEERRRVSHHLVDVRDLSESFSLADFQREATAALEDIHHRGGLPIVAGGTGLYARGLLEGYRLVECPPDPALRAALSELATDDLVAELRRLDPSSDVDPRNRRRLIRAVEICRQTGGPPPRAGGGRARGATRFRSLKIGLSRARESLVARIEARVDRMLGEGRWLEEVRGLEEKGFGPHLRRLRLLGYPELLDVLEGRQTLEEAAERIRVATRRYAKRQGTWLRAEPGVVWLDLETDPDPLGTAQRWIRRFLEDTERVSPCS